MKAKLLIAIIFLLPFGNLFRIDVGNGIAILLLEVLLGVLLLMQLSSIDWEHIKVGVFKNRILKTVLPFIILAAISLVLQIGAYQSRELLVGFSYLIRFVLYAQLLFLFSNVHKSLINKAITSLSLTGSAYVLFGLLQYFFYPDLGNLFFLGWDEHLYRLFGTFFDPNFSGAFIMLSLILLLSYRKKLEAVYRSGLYNVNIFFHVSALLLTYSRSSYVMFGTAMVLLVVYSRNLRKYAVILLLIFILGVAVLPKSYPSEGVNLLRTASINSRIEEYQKAVEVYKKSPVTGVGYNLYRYAQFKQGFTTSGNWVSSHSAAGVPNSYLFVLATTGFLGLISYMWMWVQFGLSAVKLSKARKHLSVAVIASLGGLMIHAFFENTLFYPFIMVWMFTLVGISYSSSHVLDRR